MNKDKNWSTKEVKEVSDKVKAIILEQTMNKSDLIKGLRKAAPLRSLTSWRKETVADLRELHQEGRELGVLQ